MHRPLDQLLDLYVRDGLVYYRALKSDRRSLDAYVAALERTALDGWSREEQVAFWLNAYDALVLRTVIDRYPIAGTSREYPSKSIRQIPGAFERTTHQVAGRAVTLDAIEADILAASAIPGCSWRSGADRWAAGGCGAKRSPARGSRRSCSRSRPSSRPGTSCCASTRGRGGCPSRRFSAGDEQSFVAAYADRADPRFAARSPIERAVVAFILPNLLPAETDVRAGERVRARVPRLRLAAQRPHGRSAEVSLPSAG